VISVHTEAKCSSNAPQTSSGTCPSSLGCHVGRVTKIKGVPDGKGLDSSTTTICVLTISHPADGIGCIYSSKGSVNGQDSLVCPYCGYYVTLRVKLQDGTCAGPSMSSVMGPRNIPVLRYISWPESGGCHGPAFWKSNGGDSDQAHDFHAVSIEGYDTNRFFFRNSWGSDWGNNGCGYLPFSD